VNPRRPDINASPSQIWSFFVNVFCYGNAATLQDNTMTTGKAFSEDSLGLRFHSNRGLCTLIVYESATGHCGRRSRILITQDNAPHLLYPLELVLDMFTFRSFLYPLSPILDVSSKPRFCQLICSKSGFNDRLPPTEATYVLNHLRYGATISVLDYYYSSTIVQRRGLGWV